MKYFQFDMSIVGAVSGLAKAPDKETARQWIQDDYSFGDLEVDEREIFLREIPAELAEGAGHIDVEPE